MIVYVIFYIYAFQFLCICFNKFLFSFIFTQPLAGSDYLQIAQFFHTVLIRDVPQLNLRLKSQARRFITLIDTLYDNRVRVSIFKYNNKVYATM